jgi:putative transposase
MAVAYLRETFEMSERRACTVLGCCRMTMRYQGSRVDDVDLKNRMKAIAHERRRFGYRRLHVLLRREGYVVNHKRLACSGCIGKRSSRCGVGAAGNGLSERGRRWLSP